MRRPIVWVIKEQVRREMTGVTPMDYTPAMEFGDLEFVTDLDPPIHPSSTVKPEWERQVRNMIKRFDSKNDYIVLTGSPLALFAIGKFLGAHKPDSPTKILVWRRELGRYVPTTY